MFGVIRMVTGHRNKLLLGVRFFFQPRYHTTPGRIFQPLLQFFYRIIALLHKEEPTSYTFHTMPPTPARTQHTGPVPPAEALRPARGAQEAAHFPCRSAAVHPSRHRRRPAGHPVRQRSGSLSLAPCCCWRWRSSPGKHSGSWQAADLLRHLLALSEVCSMPSGQRSFR